MTALPCGRRPARRAIASGCMRMSSLPGRLVAPRPLRRDSAPAARATAIFAPSITPRHQDAQGVRHDADRHRRVADRIAVGVDGERAVRVDVQLAAAHDAHGRMVAGARR